MNHLKRSRNNRRNNFPRKSQRGGITCANGQYVYENSCVSQCPKGTYEEEDYLPLTCTHDNWINNGLSTARVTANKLARATSSAALATSNAAQTLAHVSKEAALSAARATSSWANLRLDEAASVMYNSCRQYISNYESALATGKDVTTIPPLSQTLMVSNPDQVLSTPSVDSLPSVDSSHESSVVSSAEPSHESSAEPSHESSAEPSVVSSAEPSHESSIEEEPVDLSFKDPFSDVLFSSPVPNNSGKTLKYTYFRIYDYLKDSASKNEAYESIVKELASSKSVEEVQNILKNARIKGDPITFYPKSVQQRGGRRKRVMISRRR